MAGLALPDRRRPGIMAEPILEELADMYISGEVLPGETLTD